MACLGLVLTLVALANLGPGWLRIGLVALIDFRLAWLALVLLCAGWTLTLPGPGSGGLARSAPVLAWITIRVAA